MKNKKGLLALLLILMLSLTMATAYAGETPERPIRNPENIGLSFEERIELRITALEDKHAEFLALRLSAFQEKQSKALDFITQKLVMIENVAPELVAEYELAFNAHLDVHALLFNTTYDKQEAFGLETIANLISLKDEVLLAIEVGSMTNQEAFITLKTYIEARHEEYKTIKDAYKAEIEPLNEVNKANELIVLQLKEELRTALETGDNENATSILSELLNWSSIHTDYDYAKLAILDTY